MGGERVPVNKSTIITLIEDAERHVEYYTTKVRVCKLYGEINTNNATSQLDRWKKKLENFKELQKNL